MNKKFVTARELLKTESKVFDPMTLDLSELKELSNAMPKDGNIDANNAEVLATKYLRGADICAELLAIATAHVQRCDTEKKRAYGYAASVKATKNGIKAAQKSSWFADQDSDYITACNKYAEALGFAKWVQGKYDSFSKMHYMLKKILDRAYVHERQSNWNGTLDDETEQCAEPENTIDDEMSSW